MSAVKEYLVGVVARDAKRNAERSRERMKANERPADEKHISAFGKVLLCVDPDKCSWAKSVEERTGLTWADARQQMFEFIKENRKNHIADYSGWVKLGWLELAYTIRLYKATGKVQLKEYAGTHGTYFDTGEFDPADEGVRSRFEITIK